MYRLTLSGFTVLVMTVSGSTVSGFRVSNIVVLGITVLVSTVLDTPALAFFYSSLAFSILGLAIHRTTFEDKTRR